MVSVRSAGNTPENRSGEGMLIYVESGSVTGYQLTKEEEIENVCSIVEKRVSAFSLCF